MKRKKKHVPLRGSVIGYITEISVAMFLQIQRYIYIYNVWFQCKTSECLVSFKFLSMSCMGIFSVTISLQKAVIIKQKYLLGYLFGFF